MSFTDFGAKVFIFSNDAESAMSQKWLLEAHQCDVHLLSEAQDIPLNQIFSDDIFVLDFNSEHPKPFFLLDGLLNIPKRPKLLIMADRQDSFGHNDAIKGGAAHILFKPCETSDFLDAISLLGRS